MAYEKFGHFFAHPLKKLVNESFSAVGGGGLDCSELKFPFACATACAMMCLFELVLLREPLVSGLDWGFGFGVQPLLLAEGRWVYRPEADLHGCRFNTRFKTRRKPIATVLPRWLGS